MFEGLVGLQRGETLLFPMFPALQSASLASDFPITSTDVVLSP